MKQRSKKAYTAAVLAAVCAFSVSAFLFLYENDNKYTSEGPRGENGILILDEQALHEHPVVFLTEGWEYYGGRLLSPEDFEKSPPIPDAIIFIGQYGGFDAGVVSASPH